MPRPAEIVTLDGKRRLVTVRIDRAVYPLDAIYAACYELLDRAWVFLGTQGSRAVIAELRGKTALDARGLEALAGDLGARLLDHALRVSLARRHGKLRERIVARALASAGAAAPPPAPPPAPTKTPDDPYDVAGDWQDSQKQPRGRER